MNELEYWKDRVNKHMEKHHCGANCKGLMSLMDRLTAAAARQAENEFDIIESHRRHDVANATSGKSTPTQEVA